MHSKQTNRYVRNTSSGQLLMMIGINGRKQTHMMVAAGKTQKKSLFKRKYQDSNKVKVDPCLSGISAGK